MSTIELTEKQKNLLTKNKHNGLKKARELASAANKKAKIARIHKIQKEAKQFLKKTTINKSTLELFLVGLYLGDGFKISGRAGLGSSNPDILLLFLTLLRRLYQIDEGKLRAEIFGRADQNPTILINYWSKLLSIPKKQFHRTQLDTRTINSKTHKNYYGVCAVNYFDIGLQRRLLALSDEMVKYVNGKSRRVAQLT